MKIKTKIIHKHRKDCRALRYFIVELFVILKKVLGEVRGHFLNQKLFIVTLMVETRVYGIDG